MNQPISAIEWKVINGMCNKNEGISTVRRSYLNPDKFVVQCNDSAQFNDVTFNLTIDQPQG